ncbi:MAG: amidohydrolase, partial [Woeseiaceae bacterium]
MSGVSRRKFLGSSAALPLGLGLAGGVAAQSGTLTGSADMIITGANVLTMDYDQPVAQAIAVRGSRILAVGSNEEILYFANASTVRVDGRGMTVTPGFIDSHSHPLFAEEAVGVNVNLRRIDDVKEA